MQKLTTLLPTPNERIFHLFRIRKRDAEAFDVKSMATNALPYLDFAMGKLACRDGEPLDLRAPASLHKILLEETKRTKLLESCKKECKFLDCYRRSIALATARIDGSEEEKEDEDGAEERGDFPVELLDLYKMYRVLLKKLCVQKDNKMKDNLYSVFVPIRMVGDMGGCFPGSDEDFYKLELSYRHQWENGSISFSDKRTEYLLVSYNYATLLMLRAIRFYESSLELEKPNPLGAGGPYLSSPTIAIKMYGIFQINKINLFIWS